MSEVQDAAKEFLEENMPAIENATVRGSSGAAGATVRNKKRGMLRALVLKAFRAGYNFAADEEGDGEELDDDFLETGEPGEPDEEEDWEDTP